MSTSRGATVAEWWPWLVLPTAATALVTVGLTLALAEPGDSWLTTDAWVNAPLAVGFSVVAAGVWATRPHPPGIRNLGILFTVSGLGAACVLPSYALAEVGAPGAVAAAWLSNWVWSLGAAPLIGAGLLLYPDGRLPGRRWWIAAALGLGGTAALAVSMALQPGPLENHPHFDNPVGIGGADGWEVVAGLGFLSLIAGGIFGMAALVLKFRRAPVGGDVRGQIRGFLIVGGLVVVVATLPASDNPGQLVLALAAVTALPATVGTAVVRHRLLDQRHQQTALRQRVGALAESRRNLVNAREEERARLRRDLHDGLGPSLAAIGLGLRQLDQTAGDSSVRALADEVQRAVVEVRRICEGLRPAALNELGLSGALAEAMAPLERFGPRITLSVAELPPLAPAVEVAAFRIVMEAATNAVRHAKATNIDVQVGYDDGLMLTVDDDGAGLSPEFTPGVGLRGMSDRADEVGGWISAETSAVRGTQIRAWLPGMAHA